MEGFNDIMKTVRKHGENLPTQIWGACVNTAVYTGEKLKFGNDKLADLSGKLKEKKETENQPSYYQHFVEGVAVGAARNSWKYVVQIGGRSSNVVNIFDKSIRSSLGNPKWFARVDMPHGNVPFHHINVNPKITGVPDPHIPISAGAAQAAGTAGKVLNAINETAPMLVIASVAYDAYQVGKSVKKDVENKSSRNTIKTTATTAATIGGGMVAAGTGASIGTMIFPGVGTMIGGLVGGIIGGTGAGICSEYASEKLLNSYSYDIHDVNCKNCDKSFKNHRYQDGFKENCGKC